MSDSHLPEPTPEVNTKEYLISQVNSLGNEFDTFKEIINTQLDRLSNKIDTVESRYNATTPIISIINKRTDTLQVDMYHVRREIERIKLILISHGLGSRKRKEYEEEQIQEEFEDGKKFKFTEEST